MFRCKELNKTFSTQKEMFAQLKKHKAEIMDAKKAVIKNSDPFFCTRGTPVFKVEAIKEATGIENGDYIYPVINTTWWLDTHKDLHIDGIWDKSAKEQSGKTYYIINHDLALGSVISYPKEVEIMVKQMGWKDLGYHNFEGVTEALIFKAKITEKSNADAVAAFKDGEEIQNSIRMIYVNLDLAVNSTSEDFKEEKRIWDKYAARVVNQDALKDGYFWPIYEAKIYKEGSAVLFGSNEATPVLYEQPKHIEPPKGTQNRAADSTRVKALNNLLKVLKA